MAEPISTLHHVNHHGHAEHPDNAVTHAEQLADHLAQRVLQDERPKPTSDGWGTWFKKTANATVNAIVTSTLQGAGYFFFDSKFYLNKAADKIKYFTGSTELLDLSQFVGRAISSELVNFIPEQYVSIFQKNDRLFEQLIIVNIANGFANLAEAIAKLMFKPYDETKVFSNALTLLTSRVKKHISQQKLQELEAKYRDFRKEKREFFERLYPTDEKVDYVTKQALEESRAKAWRQLVTSCRHGKNVEAELRKMTKTELDFKTLNYLCHKEVDREKELDAIFDQAVDEIVQLFFPNKLADLILPTYYGASLINKWFYGQIRASISDLLRQLYDPIEVDPDIEKGWEESLKKLTTDQIGDVARAPAALLLGLTKHYIQSDPAIVSLVEEQINKKNRSVQVDTAELKNQELVNRLAQEELAGWVVKSVQEIIHADNIELQFLGNLFKEHLTTITLAVMSKIASRLVPPAEEGQHEQFLQRLLDGIMNDLKDPEASILLSEVFWAEFFVDIPIPNQFKAVLTRIIIEKAKLLKDVVRANADTPSMIEGAKGKMEKIVGGQNIIALTEKMANVLVDEVMVNTQTISDKLSMGSRIEELFVKFLPGLKFDDNLKEWFVQNISSLGNGGSSAQSVQLLKNAIQSLLLKGSSTLYEGHSQDQLENYSVANIRIVLSTVSLQNSLRPYLTEIMKIKGPMEETVPKIKSLKEQLSNIDRELTPGQQEAFKAYIEEENQHQDELRACHHLEMQRDALLAEFNAMSHSAPMETSRIVRLTETIHQLERRRSLLTLSNKKQLDVVKRLADLNSKVAESEAKIHQIRSNIASMRDAWQAEADFAEWMAGKEQIEANLREYTAANLLLEAQFDQHLQAQPKLHAEYQKQLGNSYTAQFFDSLQRAFDQAFPGLAEGKVDPDLKESLENMSKIQTAIEKANVEMGQLQASLPKDNSYKALLDLHILYRQNAQMITSLKFAKEQLFLGLKGGWTDKKLKELKAKINDPVTYKEELEDIPSYTLEVLQKILHIENTIERSKAEQKYLEAKIETWLREHPVRQDSMDLYKRLDRFYALSEEVAGLDAKLNALLQVSSSHPAYQTLVHELSEVFGLKRENLDLPKVILDQIWPVIESAKGKEIVRFTFEQINSLVLLLMNADQDRAKLQKLTSDNDLWGSFISQAVETAMAQLPDMIEKALKSDEIRKELETYLAGLTNLYPFIEPRLRAIVSGEDASLGNNRLVIKKYLEAIGLKYLVRIAEANKGDNLAGAITEKLAKIQEDSRLKGDREASAEAIIKDLLQDLVGVNGPSDMVGFPTALKAPVHDFIHSMLFNQLSPLVYNIMDREAIKSKLKAESGSGFLGELSEAISKDLFNSLPSFIEPKTIISSLAGLIPSMGSDMQTWLQGHLKALLDGNAAAYQNVVKIAKPYVEVALDRYLLKLATKYPMRARKDTIIRLVEELVKALAAKRAGARDLARTYDDIVFIGADANELFPTASKHVLLGNYAAQSALEIMNDVLALTAPTSLEGLPPALQGVIFNFIKNYVEKQIIDFTENLEELENSGEAVKQQKEELKKFGLNKASKVANAVKLTQDIGKFTIDLVPEVLASITGSGEMMGVAASAAGLQGTFEELARGNAEIAKVLLKYTQTPELKEKLTEGFGYLKDKNNLADEKSKAAEWIGNALLEPFNQLFGRLVNHEQELGSAENRRLMGGLLGVAVEHLKMLNKARNAAGTYKPTHQQLLEAMEQEAIHPGAPLKKISYDKSIAHFSSIVGGLESEQAKRLQTELKALGKVYRKRESEVSDQKFIDCLERVFGALSDAEKQAVLTQTDADGLTLVQIFKQDADALNLQRKMFGTNLLVDQLAPLLFPNGKDSLTFIPPQHRALVWKLLKQQLFPLIVSSLISSLLSPDGIQTIVLSSLKSLNTNLKGEIVISDIPSEAPTDEMTKIAGDLMIEAMQLVELPEWASKMVIDPKTGKVSPAIVRSLAGVFMQQFNGTFVKEKLETALAAVVERDSKGNYATKYNPEVETPEQQAAKFAKKRSEVKKAAKELVGTSIKYYLRSRWAEFMHKVHKGWQKIFGSGQISLGIKRALDKVSKFIFVKVIGTALGFIFYPFTWAINQILLRRLNLNKNVDGVLDIVGGVPEGQETDENISVFIENLVFQAAEKLREMTTATTPAVD